MVRQANGFPSQRGRGGTRGGTFRGSSFSGSSFRGSSFRGSTFRGRIGRGMSLSGRGGIHKPPPLMSRPMPPPTGMRQDPRRPRLIGPPIRPMHMPMMDDFGGMGPPRMLRPPLRGNGGGPNLRMGPRARPPLRGMPSSPGFRGGRGGLLPPPHPMTRPPVRGMFRPRPPIHPGMMGPMNMRGRGMPGRMMRGLQRGRGFGMGRGMTPTRGSASIRRGVKATRARGQKPKAVVTKEPKTVSPPSMELNKPWVTEAMKNEILKKHKLHQKAKKAKTKEDWEIFKEHRNKVTTMLREAKLEYIGAHPEEDVDKILAEATTQVSDKDESNEGAADDSETALKILEGAEPMEEGGAANEAEPPQDPEVEMTQESVSLTEPESEPEQETNAAQ